MTTLNSAYHQSTPRRPACGKLQIQRPHSERERRTGTAFRKLEKSTLRTNSRRLPLTITHLHMLLFAVILLSFQPPHTEARFTKSDPPPGNAYSRPATLESRSMSPGSGCGGSEGQWNCMTDSWQRCASGQWSVVMQCAAGTHCAPSGLTYDFEVQANSQGGGGTTAAADSQLFRASLGWVFTLAVATVLVGGWIV